LHYNNTCHQTLKVYIKVNFSCSLEEFRW